jgi:hypothetical protein
VMLSVCAICNRTSHWFPLHPLGDGCESELNPAHETN